MSEAEGPTLFAGERLTLARQLVGLRKSDLATRLGRSATAVAAWENGTKRPTQANVAELALGLGVTPSFFAPRGGTAIAENTSPHFRSLRSTSQRARDQAFAYGVLAADIAQSVEKHVEFPEPSVPLMPVALDDPASATEDAARQIRRQWEIGDGPAGHLVRLLERHGVLVVFSPEQAAAVDAYSFDALSRPTVVLNPVKNDYYRQRFDVAHELGHLVMHGDSDPGNKTVEDQAHRFAAEFLMPADQIQDLLPSSMGSRSWDLLGELKEQWGVSLAALLYRARRLGRLSDVSYRNAAMTLSQRGWRRQEPGLMTTVEQPSMLPRAIQMLEDAGISRDNLLSQTRVPSDLFETVVSRVPRLSGASGEVAGREVVSLLPRIAARDAR